MLPAFTLVLILASSLASAFPTHAKRAYSTVWTVSDYTRGCSPAGCEYTFNVTAPAINNDTSSAFTTSCSGPVSEDLENYQSDSKCDNPSVKWKLDILDTIDEIYVTHTWNGTGDGLNPCFYNVTGTQALDKEQKGTFEIVDVYIYGVC